MPPLQIAKSGKRCKWKHLKTDLLTHYSSLQKQGKKCVEANWMTGRREGRLTCSICSTSIVKMWGMYTSAWMIMQITTLHCRRQLQWAASWQCGELRRGCQIDQAWESTQGSAAGTSSLRHLLSCREGVGCWHWLGCFAGARAHGLPTLPLQGAAGDRTQPTFSQSCSLSPAPAPSSLSPCPLPRPPSLPSSHKSCSISAKGAEQPSQQSDHTPLPDSHACSQETVSNPLQPVTALKSNPLVPCKML